MNKIEVKLYELGIKLPDLPKPIANYLPAKRTGNLIYTAGQVSVYEGLIYKGKLGLDIKLD